MKKIALFAFVLCCPFWLALTQAPPAPDLSGAEVVMEGLHGPQGLFVDSEGNLWVTENGMGGEDEIAFTSITTFQPEMAKLGRSSRVIKVLADGTQEVIASLPSVAVGRDVIGAARVTELNGDVFMTMGHWVEFTGSEAMEMFGTVLKFSDDAEVFASTWEFERDNNPDGINLRESHPYGIAAGSDGFVYITDAAANSLLRLDVESGELSLVTAFEPLPGVFPNAMMDNQMLAQAVPTGVAFNDAGELFVAYLSGAPFVPGSAKVVRVSESGEVTDFAVGLTMLTDLRFAPDGNFYATQFATFGQQGPQPNSGAVIRISPTGEVGTVIDGLPLVTSIAFSDDGTAFVAINGSGPPASGLVLRYDDLLEREAAPLMGAQGN